MDKNLGFLYNCLYFQGLMDPENGDQAKEDIRFFKEGTSCLYKKLLEFDEAPHGFTLKTIYPGLVTGIGWAHECGAEEELKLGFFFDYTTGLPIIPGASVKGVLRNAFPHYKNEKEMKEGGTKMQEEKANYILCCLEDLQVKAEKDFVFALENEIFEGIAVGKTRLSVYKRDIFYDAYISGKENATFLGIDYITDHANRADSYEKSLLRDPNLVMFLKILPEVEFRFNFNLQEGMLGNLEKSAGIKEQLFKRILSDVGIGAKTNVGYGQLKEK